MTDAEDDHRLAGRLAVEAGTLLVALRAEMWERGAHPWQVMDTGDIAAHRYLLEALTEARPGDVVLSEAGADDRRRLVADRVWIVDPLDGTNEYGARGRSDWAVHVALWEAGRLAAAVSRPQVSTHPLLLPLTELTIIPTMPATQITAARTRNVLTLMQGPCCQDPELIARTIAARAGTDPADDGQPRTRTSTVCQPVAPSGAGGLRSSVWVAPSPSVARHVSV